MEFRLSSGPVGAYGRTWGGGSVVQAGCDESVDQDGSGVGSEGRTEAVNIAKMEVG